MIISDAIVKDVQALSSSIFLMQLTAPEISSIIKPGQFLNIKADSLSFPLLRRPFSVCDVNGDSFSVMFDIHGLGTKLLSEKKQGDVLNLIGPLGNGFSTQGDFDLAIMIAGGLGIAPFPFLAKSFDKSVSQFLFYGARNNEYIVEYPGLIKPFIATDDGSLGEKGNVLDLLKNNKEIFNDKRVKLFVCGPTPMLRAIAEFALAEDLDCEVSTECAMACGFGICQGCPIESKIHPETYALVCKDGPVFNVKEVVI